MMHVKRRIKSFLGELMRKHTIVSVPILTLARAGVVPPQFCNRIPITATFSIDLPDGRRILYTTSPGDAIGNALFWRGLKSYEPETVKVFYELARGATVVLDIGANTGLYTLMACAANNQARVVSFEPVPQVYQRLVENIKLNGYLGRCELLQVAVSSATGCQKLHVPDTDVPLSASLNPEGFRGHKGTLLDVSVTTVDAACYGLERVDLVKLDVEGFEDKVLEGMERVLELWAPDLIVECNPDGPYRRVQGILSRFGYHFFHLRKGGHVLVPDIIPDPSERWRNFLCTVKPGSHGPSTALLSTS